MKEYYFTKLSQQECIARLRSNLGKTVLIKDWDEGRTMKQWVRETRKGTYCITCYEKLRIKGNFYLGLEQYVVHLEEESDGTSITVVSREKVIFGILLALINVAGILAIFMTRDLVFSLVGVFVMIRFNVSAYMNYRGRPKEMLEPIKNLLYGQLETEPAELLH